MAKVFITGITGFLGSSIANHLVNNNHDVVAIYRSTSSKELCTNFLEKVTWVLQDNEGKWIEALIKEKPEVVIHTAWIGVGHFDRNNWEQQMLNIDFLRQILLVARKADSKKFIGLGSQAEYGKFNGCITENYPLEPTEAYGSVKIISSEIVRQFCRHHQIDWYWLRLFSFFGERESENWLIPSLIKKISISDNMDLTLGEQKYSYLYADDLGSVVDKIMVKHNKSGIYNISGETLVTLKELITKIRDAIKPQFKLNFGELSYRENQSMHMQGNSKKFIEAFGEFEVSDFEESMLKTIYYLKEKFKA